MPGFDKFTYQGEPFRGEFSAVDATTQVLTTAAGHQFSLFAAGSTTAITVNTGDRVMISDILLVAQATDTFTIYDGTDINADVGEKLATVRVSTNNGYAAVSLNTPAVCQASIVPKIIGSSTVANLVATIYGVVKRAV